MLLLWVHQGVYKSVSISICQTQFNISNSSVFNNILQFHFLNVLKSVYFRMLIMQRMVLFHILIQSLIWIFDFKSLMFPLFSFYFPESIRVAYANLLLIQSWHTIYVLNTQCLVLSLKIWPLQSYSYPLPFFFYPQLIYTP